MKITTKSELIQNVIQNNKQQTTSTQKPIQIPEVYKTKTDFVTEITTSSFIDTKEKVMLNGIRKISLKSDQLSEWFNEVDLQISSNQVLKLAKDAVIGLSIKQIQSPFCLVNELFAKSQKTSPKIYRDEILIQYLTAFELKNHGIMLNDEIMKAIRTQIAWEQQKMRVDSSLIPLLSQTAIEGMNLELFNEMTKVVSITPAVAQEIIKNMQRNLTNIDIGVPIAEIAIKSFPLEIAKEDLFLTMFPEAFSSSDIYGLFVKDNTPFGQGVETIKLWHDRTLQIDQLLFAYRKWKGFTDRKPHATDNEIAQDQLKLCLYSALTRIFYSVYYLRSVVVGSSKGKKLHNLGNVLLSKKVCTERLTYTIDQVLQTRDIYTASKIITSFYRIIFKHSVLRYQRFGWLDKTEKLTKSGRRNAYQIEIELMQVVCKQGYKFQDQIHDYLFSDASGRNWIQHNADLARWIIWSNYNFVKDSDIGRFHMIIFFGRNSIKALKTHLQDIFDFTAKQRRFIQETYQVAEELMSNFIDNDITAINFTEHPRLIQKLDDIIYLCLKYACPNLADNMWRILRKGVDYEGWFSNKYISQTRSSFSLEEILPILIVDQFLIDVIFQGNVPLANEIISEYFSNPKFRPMGNVYRTKLDLQPINLNYPGLNDILFHHAFLSKYFTTGKWEIPIQSSSHEILWIKCGSNYEVAFYASLSGILHSTNMKSTRSSRYTFKYQYGGKWKNSQFDGIVCIGQSSNLYLIVAEVLSDGGVNARVRGGRRYNARKKVVRDYYLRQKGIASIIVGPDKYCNNPSGTPDLKLGTVQKWFHNQLFLHYLNDPGNPQSGKWWEPYFTLPADITVKRRIIPTTQAGTFYEFWDLMYNMHSHGQIAFTDFSVLHFLQKLIKMIQNLENEWSYIQQALRILEVFEWNPLTCIFPIYVQDWIADFDFHREDAVCRLLWEIKNKNPKKPSDFAFAQWILQQFFKNIKSTFFGMTANQIIERIYKLYNITPPSTFPFSVFRRLKET